MPVTYDAENRLTGYGGSTLTAGYTGDNLRVWKQNSAGTRTYFLYDGASPVCELSSTGAVTATNTWGVNGLLSRRVGSTSSFYTFDLSGNTAQTLNSTGAVTLTAAVSAFGQRTASGATIDPYSGLDGQWGCYNDPETGLFLMGHRYYSSAAGRFLTRDPMGYAGGINLYAYCGNDPVNESDPTGFCGGPDGGDDYSLSPWDIFNPLKTQAVVNQAARYAGEGEMSPWAAVALGVAGGGINLVEGAVGGAALGAGASLASDLARAGADVASNAADDAITVYRGTSRASELDAYGQTGYLLSDAAKQAFLEGGNLTDALDTAANTHQDWIDLWGSEADYAQAHSAFGTELPQAFGMSRTFMSVTTDAATAENFAGAGGRVFTAQVSASSMIPGNAAESEYLIRLGSGGFK